MLQQLATAPYEVLTRGVPLMERSRNRATHRTSCGGVVADRDAPLFALLRGTLGLPLDDRRWWPERPARRGSGPSVADVVAEHGGHVAGGRHILVADEVFAPAHEFSAPTVALLERALAGLRAWDTAGADTSRPTVRHLFPTMSSEEDSLSPQ